jgi:hypothetical protein
MWKGGLTTSVMKKNNKCDEEKQQTQQVQQGKQYEV